MKKIVGMWNPSVILTYVGMAFAVVGMFLAFKGERINYSFICLIVSGVCDLFDGSVARKVKRTEEEKAFGIELDSLVDVISFIALPLTIFIAMGMTGVLHLCIYLFYTLTGIARLGYFNVATADSEGPVKYYMGLPVTYVALVFPVVYLLKYVTPDTVFQVLYTVAILVVTVLELIKVKIAKPRGIAYGFFGLLAVGAIVLYMVIV